MTEQPGPPANDRDDDFFKTTLDDVDLSSLRSDSDSSDEESEKKEPVAQTGIATLAKDRDKTDEEDKRIQDAGFTLAKNTQTGKGVDAAASFDGLGGYGGGHDASRIAAEEFEAQLAELPTSARVSQIANTLEIAWQNADTKINTELEEGLTTASVVVVTDKDYVIAHIGDSRAYAITSNGELRQLTEDGADVLSWIPPRYQQEFMQDMDAVTNQNFDRIEQKWQKTAKSTREGGSWNPTILERAKNNNMSLFYYLYGHRNAISGALGKGEGSKGRISTATRRAEDILVFTCSDGVHDNLTTAQIEAVVDDAFDNQWTPQQFAEALAKAAHEVSLNGTFRSKEDDIVVACVEVVSPARTEEAAGEATNVEATNATLDDDLEGETVRGIDPDLLKKLREAHKPTIEVEVFPEGTIKLDLGESIDIGRGVFGAKDLKIDESSMNPQVVSRQHANLRRGNLGFSISDMASSHGTYVNGSPAESSYVLQHNDVIMFGRTSNLVGPQFKIEILAENAIRFVELDAEGEPLIDQTESSLAEKLSQPENMKQAFQLLLTDELFMGDEYERLADVQRMQRRILKKWGWLPKTEVTPRIKFSDPSGESDQIRLVASTLKFLSILNTLWVVHFFPQSGKFPDVDAATYVTAKQSLDSDLEQAMHYVTGPHQEKQVLKKILMSVFEEKQRQLKVEGRMPTNISQPTNFEPPSGFPLDNG